MTHQQAVESMAAERYLLDEMSEIDRDQFEEHYFTCDTCAEDVRLGAVLRDEVRASAGQAARTQDEPARAPRRLEVMMPWAAAAAFALVSGYQSLVVAPRLRELISAQPLSPIVLHATSRGDIPTLVPGRSGTFVSLAMDVDAGAATRVSYEMRRDSAAVVLSGDAPAPAQGMAFLLLVPAGDIEAPGDYTLTVTDASSSSALGEYRFRVAGH